MKENTVVSVVVPFFNRSAFLERLLNSILRQTVSVSQVYIIDNGSASAEIEKSAPIIKKFVRKGLDIVWLSSVKKGNANVARNLGMDLASTKYVAFLDSDDWWEAEHIECSLMALEKSQRSASYSGCIIHYPGRTRVARSRDVNSFKNVFAFLYGPKPNACQTSSYLVRRDVGRRVRWDEALKRHQDIDYFISVAIYTNGWEYVDKQLVNFDLEYGGAKAIDYRSMIRFIKKWESKISGRELVNYYRRHVIIALRRNANPMYVRYYKSRYISSEVPGRFVRMLYCQVGCFEKRDSIVRFLQRYI